jgi:hypothetical protein
MYSYNFNIKFVQSRSRPIRFLSIAYLPERDKTGQEPCAKVGVIFGGICFNYMFATWRGLYLGYINT